MTQCTGPARPTRRLVAALLLGGFSIAACGADGDGGTTSTEPSADTSDAGSASAAGAPELNLVPDPSPGHLLMSTFQESTHTFLTTFTIRPDGSDQQDIPMPGDEGGGRWSHAGDEIAVATTLTDGRIGTAILAPDGTVERVLEIGDPTLNLPCTVWSPDDQRLGCEGWDEGDPTRTGLYTVRAGDGGGLVRLTSAGEGQTDFTGDYSPDGTWFLFKRSHDEDLGPIMKVSVDGGDPETVGESRVEDPGRYSPDGRTILTSSAGRLLLLTADGAVLSEVAEGGAFLFGPVWSPDGSRIAFSRYVSGTTDVFTSLPDGTDRRQVTATPANEIRVEWGPA
jgi:WD40-like Beta Propeller Repeat